MARSLTELVSLPLIAADQDANQPKPQWPYNITTNGGGTTGGTWTSLPIPVGSGSTGTATGNVTANSGAIGNVAGVLQAVGQAKAAALVKDQLRIIIQKTDGSQLILEEQTVITPQEMIGLSKFFMLMSCATTVFSQANSGYNITINWSEVVKNLSIERHFVSGMQGSVGNTQTNVLDITLFDPT